MTLSLQSLARTIAKARHGTDAMCEPWPFRKLERDHEGYFGYTFDGIGFARALIAQPDGAQ